MKKQILFLACFITSFAYGADQTVQLASPNGSIKVEIIWNENPGQLSYTVQNGATEVISASSLGITTSAVDFTTGLSYVSGTPTSANETYSLPSGKVRSYRNQYNALDIALQKSGKEVHVIFRAYNDGIAYRYLISGSGSVSVTGETSEINIASFDKCWGQKYVDDYSTQYPARTWAEASSVSNNEFCAPILTKHATDANAWCLITEAANFGTYSTSKIKSGNASQIGKFYFQKVGNITSTLPLQTPWRTVIIGSLPTIVESVLIENLNPPTAASDLSWIQPGVSSWDWGGQDGGQTNDIRIVKGYIDLAYKMGWKYYVLDEGWERSSYTLKSVVDYANSKGVKVIIWSHQNRFQNSEAQIRPILQQWKNLGFAGVKVDFWQDDSQAMTQKQDKLISIAGELQLLVNLHGCTKPSGTRRYWPHLITSEAVYGGEQYYFNHLATPAYHNVTLALTRNVIGPMDYTPVEFARLDGVIRHTTSWSHQLALAVLYESGVQCMSDASDNYLYSSAKNFLQKFPTVWDEIKCLEASVDQYITIARRNAQDWYVASISQEARTVSIPLSFLGSGTYQAQIYKDGSARSEIDYEQQAVTSATTLSIPLLPQGGVTVRISQTPIKAPETLVFEAEDGTMSDGARILTDDDEKLASGGKFVGYIGSSGKLKINNVPADRSGRYDLTIFLITKDERNTYVRVNNGTKTNYVFKGNGFSWASDGLAFKTVPISLNQGMNTIEFGNDTGVGINIDRVVVQPHRQDREYENLYLVGNATSADWTKENAILLEKDDDIFSWHGKLQRGELKFLTDKNVWTKCLNATTENEKIILDNPHPLVYVEDSHVTNDDYKFIVDEEDVYSITIDTRSMTMVMKKSTLISVSSIDGKGKRVVNIHSVSGKTNDTETPYKLFLGKEENLKSNENKWAYKGDTPWVIFSLAGIYSIERIGFRDGRIRETGNDVYNIPEYKVFVSTTGTADGDWTEIIHETGVGDIDEKIKAVNPVEARYLKFVPVKDSRDEYVRIYGFDIYGTLVRPINEDIVSHGKSIVNYHNSYSHRETPANILDGNTESAVGVDANNSWAFYKGGNGWVIIDLEKRFDLSKFELVDSEDWINGYQVYVSNLVGDDSDWRLVFEGSFPKEQVRKVAQLNTPVTGRYVKLQIPAAQQNGWNRIREFEIYGTPAPYPQIETNHALLKSAYDLAIKTVKDNTTQAGILRAGADYGGEWTRDIAINMWNGVSLFDPDIAKKSLWSVTENNKQNIGHQYWDKIIWVKGAYTYYLATHDSQFLSEAFTCGFNTIQQLEAAELDASVGLFKGPSVFNDGIAGYETPIYDTPHSGFVLDFPAATQIKCLSTNAVYYEAYVLLAEMAEILGENDKAPALKQKAQTLKNNIRSRLFDAEKGWLNYLIDQNGDIHPHQEGLGVAFSILFDIVNKEEARKIIDQIYVSSHGLPSIYPHFKRFSDAKPGRHNVLIWPFVNAFWADACLKAGARDKFTFELLNLADLAINKGKNNFYEIYNPISGLPDGGWQQGSQYQSCKHQTWSATGFLNMIYYGIAGIQPEPDQIRFNPYLPEQINHLKLTELKYAGMTLQITLNGKGSKIKTFKLNGNVVPENTIPNTLSGTQVIEIELEEDLSGIDRPEQRSEHPLILLPKDDALYLLLDGDYLPNTVQLYDVYGRKIASEKNVLSGSSIASHLAKGVYVLQFDCKEFHDSRKVVL